MAPGEPIRRVVFLRTDRLGETLLAAPAVAALARALPSAAVTFVSHPHLTELLSRLPGVERVVAAPQGPRPWWWIRALRLGWWLRRQRFDLAVVANPKQELHAAVWLAGIPRRVGYDRKWGWMLTRRLPDEKGLGERHEVEYNLDLIRALGLPVSVPEVVLSLVASEDATVLQLLEAHGITRDRHFVVIHPWASHARKEWPLERAQALAGQITQRLGWGVAIIGGAESRGRLDAARWDAGRIVDLVGRLSLTQLAALLARARVAVSTDSGPMHLAAAVGTPTVALFGTSDPATGPRRWGPWGAGHTVIWKPSMEAIGVPDVLRALEQQRSMRRLDVSA